jgi:hypothetical protein
MQIRVGLNAQLFDTPEIDRTGTTVSTVNGVPLLQQQFRQVGAVLTRNASNDCFHANPLNSILSLGWLAQQNKTHGQRRGDQCAANDTQIACTGGTLKRE